MKIPGPAAAGFFVTALLVLGLDQLSKAWIVSNFLLHETRNIIPGFFNITFITNTGAAFGFLAGADDWRHIFLVSVSCAALGGLAFLFWSAPHRNSPFTLGTALVFGGALGNLIDRIRYGSVIDFLDFYIGTHHWPAFNVADSAITVGGALLAWHFMRPSAD